MTDWTASEFRGRFPEFSESRFSGPVVDRAIKTAYLITDVTHEATGYCIAHLLSTMEAHAAEMDGGAGEITSETTGPRMQSFMTQAEKGREVFFTTTPYGRTCLTLEKRSPRRGIAAFYY